jgi:mannose-6-phosphate isomerase-like protein (cupin superfamily)
MTDVSKQGHWNLQSLISQAKESGRKFQWKHIASSKNFTASLVYAESGDDLKGERPGNHIHDDQDTFDVILEGEAQLRVGDEEYSLKAGDALFIPAGVPHGLAKGGKARMWLLSIYMPFLDPKNPNRRPVQD